jgi:hypothetical protein
MNKVIKLSMLALVMVGCSSKTEKPIKPIEHQPIDTASQKQEKPQMVVNYVALREFYPEEFDTIMEAAKANDCTQPLLICVLFAIRTAENGREGIEFGVLHPRAVDQPNSLRVQAGWCAATISKNYNRWIESGEKTDFFTFLGNRYCPVGADNDPNGLNKHWIPNVEKITMRNASVIYK